MAGKNQKASTLPPGLKYSTQQTEETEGFFSRLKKKLKLKKGKYNVDVNTGECENIAAVSFRKRESKDLGEEDPWKHQDNPPRASRSQSPRPKHTLRTQSDRIQGPKLGKHVRKHSFPENQILSLKNSTKMEPSSQNRLQKSMRVGNEYSKLDYENREVVSERPRLSKGNTVVNDHIVKDDCAIDLDKCDPHMSDSSRLNFNFNMEPGYQEVSGAQKTNAKSDSALSDPQKSPDWDPRYESLNDVKQKLREQFHETARSEKNSAEHSSPDYDPRYQSVGEAKGDESLEDPLYQSVKDLKDRKPEDSEMKPAKTYNVNQSIDSLDEPGYECLNDVKKRVLEQNHVKRKKERSKSKEEVGMGVGGLRKKVDQLSFENLSGSRTSERRHSGTPDSSSGIKGLTETALSLTEIATALTGSGMSKDSGFQSKERSVDSEMGGKHAS